MLPLGTMTAEQALKLLECDAAGRGLSAGADLCEALGYLPFAVKLAGKRMALDGQSAAALLASVKDAPETLTAPDELAYTPGRDSIMALFGRSVDALDADGQAAFSAWGAFWSSTMTAELLALYYEPGKSSVI